MVKRVKTKKWSPRGAKTYFGECTCKFLKITFPDRNVHFYLKEVIFMNLCTAEINFLAMNKIFCPGQIIFVMCLVLLLGQNFCPGGFVQDKIEIVRENFFIQGEKDSFFCQNTFKTNFSS